MRGRGLKGATAAALCLLAAACAEPEDLGPALNTTPPAFLPARYYPPEGWTWGLIQVGDHPPHRYGVAGPRGTSRGDIVIIPGVGEPAEAWFDAANDLIAAGWTIWIMDLAGQGGSGRATSPRDLRHTRDRMIDVVALQHLLGHLVVARPQRRTAMLASGASASVALLATAEPPVCTHPDPRACDVAVVILNQPDFGTGDEGRLLEAVRPDETAPWADAFGAGALRVWGGRGWSSNGDEEWAVPGHRQRHLTSEHWMRANPSLRSGDPSWSWWAADVRLREQSTGLSQMQSVVLPPDAEGDVWLAAVLRAAEGSPADPRPLG